MPTILFLILSAQASAPLHLNVSSAQVNFSLEMGPKEVIFRSNKLKLNHTIKPCGEPSLAKLTNKIRSEIKTEIAKSAKKFPNAIQATLDHEQSYLPPLSSAGILMSKMETEVDYAISEANYRCSRK